MQTEFCEIRALEAVNHEEHIQIEPPRRDVFHEQIAADGDTQELIPVIKLGWPDKKNWPDKKKCQEFDNQELKNFYEVLWTDYDLCWTLKHWPELASILFYYLLLLLLLSILQGKGMWHDTCNSSHVTSKSHEPLCLMAPQSSQTQTWTRH